jgi:hypothetical protein
MTNIRIDDISAIKEQSSLDESRKIVGKVKHHAHVECPTNHGKNYQCPICNRLRAVCPFSRGETHSHVASMLNATQEQSKSFNSTMVNDRLKTYSTM